MTCVCVGRWRRSVSTIAFAWSALATGVLPGAASRGCAAAAPSRSAVASGAATDQLQTAMATAVKETATKVVLPSWVKREAQARYRAIQWTYAAINSVEPAILNVFAVTVFHADQEWAKLRRPGAEEFARLKLKRVSDWLGDKPWLEGDSFTIGDLIMVTVLRFLNHTGMVAEFPNLAAYQKRGEARPAFQRALSAQLAVFAANQPEPEAAAA